MRRVLIAATALCMVFLLASGCADAAGTDDDNASANANANANANVNVDVDFTRLSRIMAEAEFRNVLQNSADYIGKTVRASGEYFSLFINESDRYHHFVTIVDGDAVCCPPEGFEIKLTGDDVSLDDYPEQNTMIEVTGVLGRFEELGQRFLYLAVDEIIIL